MIFSFGNVLWETEPRRYHLDVVVMMGLCASIPTSVKTRLCLSEKVMVGLACGYGQSRIPLTLTSLGIKILILPESGFRVECEFYQENFANFLHFRSDYSARLYNSALRGREGRRWVIVTLHLNWSWRSRSLQTSLHWFGKQREQSW